MSFDISSVDVDADRIPPYPPAEVLDALAVAAAAHARLAARGRSLRFDLHEPSGRVTITVHDEEGRQLRTLSATRALDVAAGADPGV